MARTHVRTKHIYDSRGVVNMSSWVEGSTIYVNAGYNDYGSNSTHHGYHLLPTVQRYVNGKWTEIERKFTQDYWFAEHSGVTVAFYGYVKKGTPVRIRFAISPGVYAYGFSHKANYKWYNMSSFTF